LKHEKDCEDIFGLLSSKEMMDDTDCYTICNIKSNNDTLDANNKSYPITKIQYKKPKNVCFYISKSEDTLHQKYCTHFIHVPCLYDYLDSTTKLAIVLHSFITTILDCYCEDLGHSGYKYNLDAGLKIHGRNNCKRENGKDEDVCDDDAIDLLNGLFIEDEE